ncbi:hypothetical protein FQ186_25735 [Pseudomonas sp. ANT_H14]|nr:hypothetical protein FQ182_28290 [Pseudomonas sp. ANT_H4]KAA0947192.1 hypothetical protein FQ186_25735 [Pseudomonas sp. ANT_H14]
MQISAVCGEDLPPLPHDHQEQIGLALKLLDDASHCSGLMKPDTHLGENARQIEVSDDQTTPFLFC